MLVLFETPAGYVVFKVRIWPFDDRNNHVFTCQSHVVCISMGSIVHYLQKISDDFNFGQK